MKWFSLKAKKKKPRGFNPLQYCLIVSTQKAYIQVNTKKSKASDLSQNYTQLHHMYQLAISVFILQILKPQKATNGT
jgi:hypothetical protein